MTIIYEDKLKDYMLKKGIEHILIESYAGNSCTGFPEISARFADIKTAERTKKRGCRIIQGEVGEILILTRGLKYNDTITLGIHTFMGIKVVTVDGIRP